MLQDMLLVSNMFHIKNAQIMTIALYIVSWEIGNVRGDVWKNVWGKYEKYLGKCVGKCIGNV